MNKKIEQIKSIIDSIEYILNGSVSEQYRKCGKQNCRCHEDRKDWHGPYWIWTRKEGGKTITKSLNKNQVLKLKKAIKQMKDLNLLIEKWKEISLTELDKVRLD